jgi:ABC-type multidrug transport system ATPase subunit
MPLINISILNLKFNDFDLFRNLNLIINNGEKIAFTGQSGSGKSTLINTLMGFQRIDSGSLKIKDMEMNQLNVIKIRNLISWLPQNVNLPENGTVMSSILKPFTFRFNIHNKPSNEQIYKLAEIFLIDSKIFDNPFSSASGGEKQRIALIIAILLKREIMIFDEPTSSLDDKSAETVLEYLSGLKERTIICATHDKRWIDKCDKILELHK